MDLRQLSTVTSKLWFLLLPDSHLTLCLVGVAAVLLLLNRNLSSTGRRLSSYYPFSWLSNYAQKIPSKLVFTENALRKHSITCNSLAHTVNSIYTLPAEWSVGKAVIPQRLSSSQIDDLLAGSQTDAPSPLALPLIGHIYLLAKYPTNPWQGFNAIRQEYGNVVRLQLGKFRSVLVSSTEAIREVLLVKGDAFADRPHFERHALIFGRNRQNALALCDWSDIHKSRRSIAHAAVIPRFGTGTFKRLSEAIDNSVGKLLIEVNESLSKNGNGTAIMQKERLLRLCGAIFVEFLLEKEVEVNSAPFKDVCDRYDFIFYDINQMYLCDFLPFLQPITARQYFKDVADNSEILMKFINDQVIERYEQLLEQKEKEKQEALKSQQWNPEIEAKYDEKSCDERFVDRILLHKQYQSSAQFLDFILNHYLENQHSMTWDEALYEIADLVGGNSAVANLLARLLGHLAANPGVQEQLHEEALSVLNEAAPKGKVAITLKEQPHMPLTNASIMETLRLASSPIVPHLSRYDTSIQGYFIPKNTMVLFNVYHLNLSSDLWQNPSHFDPSRFVTKEGNVMKPDFFFPFSHGRRSCLGYKMVNTVIFSVVSNLLVHYRLEAGTPANAAKMTHLLEPRGSIALPFDDTCYNFSLVPRK